MMRDRWRVAVTQRSQALAETPRMHGWARVLVATGCVLGVVAIAFVDYLMDVRASLGVFYLVPTVIAVVLIGPLAGVVIAAFGATAWVVADAMIDNRSESLAFLAVNGLLRWLPFTLVVLLLAELRRLLERTRRSEHQSREFLAFAAHQLRTPVAGVQATAEALLLRGNGSAEPRAATDAETEQLLSNLAGEVSRVGRLVQSLLRVARLDQGEAIDVRDVDVVKACEAEAERFRHSSTVEVDVQASGAVPPALKLDGHDLAEIVGNLLENACRHADSRVEVDVGVTGYRERSVRIEVRDDGPGVPPGCEETVFNRFVSLDGHGGSGLGLTIVRSLAAKHGGTVVYADRAFTVVLPVD